MVALTATPTANLHRKNNQQNTVDSIIPQKVEIHHYDIVTKETKPGRNAQPSNQKNQAQKNFFPREVSCDL